MRVGSSTYSGFTFIEVILALLLAILVISLIVSIYPYKHSLEENKIIRTDENKLMIENALKFYKLDNGFYPTLAQGLDALVHKPSTPPIPLHWIPYLKQIPTDTSGRPYRYITPGRVEKTESNS